jgi:hypothetical protein
MKTAVQNFEQFMKEREGVAQAYVQGDAGPLGHIVTHTGAATFSAPGWIPPRCERGGSDVRAYISP